MSVSRNHEWHGSDQMRCDSEKGRALAAGCAHALDVRVLQIADAAVHHLEAVRRGAGAELNPLNQRRRVATQRSLARRSRARSPAADHEHVEALTAQRMKIPMQHEGTHPTGNEPIGRGAAVQKYRG